MPNEPLQEVLGVKIDTSEFQAGLAQLKSLWDSFVAQIGSENIDKVLGAGAFGGILSGFNELKDAITQISAEAYQSIEALSGSVTTALGRIEQAERDAAETAARSKTGGKGGYDDHAEASKFASEQDAALQKSREAQSKVSKEIEIEQQGLVDRFAELEDRKYEIAFQELVREEAAQQKFAQTITVEQEGLVNQFEEQQLRKQSIAEAVAARIASSQKKLAEEISIEQEGIATKAEEADTKRISAAEAAAAKIASANKKLAEEITIEQQGIVDQYILAQEKMAEAAEVAARKEAESTAKRDKANSFLGGLSGDDGIASQIGRVARFAVEWQLVGTAINGVMAVIAAPFKAVADGLKYLQDLEATAEQISGVLLENVKYSDDLAENFHKAAAAAPAVVQALQAMSVRDKIKPEVLQNTFQNVLEAGAGRGTKNTEDTLKVTELLATSFKTLGINARSSRTEIENALNGTPASGSKFLELMKMSSAEWVKQRDLAYDNGTLVDTLASRLEPFVEASKRAGDTQGNLIEMVKLLGTRLEATFAQPLFNEFTQILQSVLSWLDKNKDSAEGLAKAFGSLVAEMVGVTTGGEGLKTFAKTLIELFANLTAAVEHSVESLKTLPVLMAAVAEFSINPVKSASDIKSITEEYSKSMEEIARKRDLVVQSLYHPGSTQSHTATSLAEAQSDPLLAPTTPGTPPPNTTKTKAPPSEIPDDMVKFETELKRIKAGTKEKLDDEKDAVDAKTKSQEQSTKDVLNLIKQEDSAVQALVGKYKALVAAAKDANTPAGKQRIKTTTDRLTGIGEASTDSTSEAARQSGNQDIRSGVAQREDANRAALSSIEKSLREEVAAKEAAHKEENISEEELLQSQIDAQTRAHNARQAIYLLELVQAVSGTQAHKDALDKSIQDEDAYTSEVKRLTGLRVDAHDKENEKRAAHSVTLSKSREEADTAADTVDASFVGAKGDLSKFDNTAGQIEKARALAVAALKAKDGLDGAADAVRKLELELAKLSVDRLNNLNAELSAIKNSRTTPLTQQRLTTSAVQTAVTGAGRDLHNANSRVDTARANGANPQKLKELTDQADAAAKSLGKLSGVAQDDPGSKAGKTPALVNGGIDAVLGPTFKQRWDDASGALDKTTLALGGMGNAVGLVQNTLNAMAQGRKQGGTLGGLGAGASSVGSALSSTGVPGLEMVGAAASAVGSIMSIIGTAMMAETIRISNGIKAAISSTTTAYQEQSANLTSTIAAMEQERANAVASLSGMKGGWDQLQSILQSLDPEIASLREQASQLVTAFAYAFNQAQMQVSGTTDALSTVYQQWVTINQQVIDYINAGGDAATATQYLSDQLVLMQQAAQETLNEGQQQAVQDAITLNGLLLQRTLLVQNLNTQAFALQNQDAEERTESGVVTRAEQLQAMQRDNQQQLADLNYQIQTAQEKVTAESQVFTIATNIADLHRQDDQLTLAALDLQLDKYTALQQLVASITQGANGLFSSTEGFLQPTTNNLGPTITLNGGINVTVVAADGADPAAVGTAVADSVSAELANAARMSPVG